MPDESQIVRALHEDHMAVLGLLSRLETASRVTTAPTPDDAAFRTLSSELTVAIETEVRGHFDFEEKDLFPSMREVGFGDLADLLIEEHGLIWPVAVEVVALLRSNREAGWSESAWSTFRPLALELVERLQSHIEKEERALAQAVIDTFDEDEDAELAMAYAS